MVSKLVLQTGLAARVCNLFVSNVPGPQFPVYMNGAKQVGSYGLAPLGDGMGLFIGTPSYNGKMSFNVISTREIMPDISFFIECLQLSLNELLTLAATLKPRQKGAAGKSSRRTAAARSGKRAAGGKAKASQKARPKSAAVKKPVAGGKKAAGERTVSQKAARKKAAAKRKTAGKTPAKQRGERQS
jgi:hypothetical protein